MVILRELLLVVCVCVSQTQTLKTNFGVSNTHSLENGHKAHNHYKLALLVLCFQCRYLFLDNNILIVMYLTRKTS